jgi:hypothetical protein
MEYVANMIGDFIKKAVNAVAPSMDEALQAGAIKYKEIVQTAMFTYFNEMEDEFEYQPDPQGKRGDKGSGQFQNSYVIMPIKGSKGFRSVAIRNTMPYSGVLEYGLIERTPPHFRGAAKFGSGEYHWHTGGYAHKYPEVGYMRKTLQDALPTIEYEIFDKLRRAIEMRMGG